MADPRDSSDATHDCSGVVKPIDFTSCGIAGDVHEYATPDAKEKTLTENIDKVIVL